MDKKEGKEKGNVGSVCYSRGDFGGDLGFFRLVIRMREAQRRDRLDGTLESMEERRRWEREVDSFIKRNLRNDTVNTLFD